jgi:hypothetical protein
MSKMMWIKRELATINEARFQLLCNAFLAFHYRGSIQSPGTMETKEKTKKGKPDTFIQLQNGKRPFLKISSAVLHNDVCE